MNKGLFNDTLLTLENNIIKDLKDKFNLLLNEFKLIDNLKENISTRRISFDSKTSDLIFQINNNFSKEKQELFSSFDPSNNYNGYISFNKIINRDNIYNFIEKSINLLIYKKLEFLYDDKNILFVVNEIITAINSTTENLKSNFIQNKISLDLENNTIFEINKKEDTFVINYLFSKERKLSLLIIKKELKNFFLDININLNSIFLIIFNKQKLSDIIKLPIF